MNGYGLFAARADGGAVDIAAPMLIGRDREQLERINGWEFRRAAVVLPVAFGCGAREAEGGDPSSPAAPGLLPGDRGEGALGGLALHPSGAGMAVGSAATDPDRRPDGGRIVMNIEGPALRGAEKPWGMRKKGKGKAAGVEEVGGDAELGSHDEDAGLGPGDVAGDAGASGRAALPAAALAQGLVETPRESDPEAAGTPAVERGVCGGVARSERRAIPADARPVPRAAGVDDAAGAAEHRTEDPRTRRPTVVNLRGLKKALPGDVYIGRASRFAELAIARKTSPWHNPFKVGKDGTRDECCRMFRTLLEDELADPTMADALRERLRSLAGKRLLCWCAPERCHGNEIADLVEEVLRDDAAAGDGAGGAEAAEKGDARGAVQAAAAVGEREGVRAARDVPPAEHVGAAAAGAAARRVDGPAGAAPRRVRGLRPAPRGVDGRAANGLAVREQTLACVRAAGPEGATYADLVRAFGIERNAANERLRSLRALGMIEIIGKRRVAGHGTRGAGRPAIVYAVKGASNG